MQSANPLLPGEGFTVERLLPPHQAIVAYFSRVAVAPPASERVAFEDSFGRVLARPIEADDDYPAAPRSAMDGFAVRAEAMPGEFDIVDEIAMGASTAAAISGRAAVRIPTGGMLPEGADTVVPIEDVRLVNGSFVVDTAIAAGENVIEVAADMRRGEPVLDAGRRIRAPEIGVLATLGVTTVDVLARPAVAIISSGDELVDPHVRPRRGEIRDSNRYAIAASLRAMGAIARHYPTLRDEAAEFESTIETALRECDAVVVTGGSSVGERDRLPRAVAAIADPGIIVHGLRVKPGKPTLLGADGGKPIIGLPGNPTSALMILEAVAAPVIAALCGAPVAAPAVRARLAQTARSRAGWTWYVPVRVHDDGGTPLADPLPLRSFSVSLMARADGYIVMTERDEEWLPGTTVTVTRFLGG